MNRKFPAHWLEEIVDEILERDVKEITLSTGKTPSGHIHIGILREILICDSLKRVFDDKGYNVKNYLFLDDLDAAKRFPEYIDKEFQKSHLGKPFTLIPCPFNECNCNSYAFHFGNELISTFKDFGINIKPVWTHELYKKKEMQEQIKLALENTNLIKNILKKYILPTLDDDKKKVFIEMQKTWTPVMAICENCNKIQFREKDGSIKPNRIIKYEKKNLSVSYKCPACGHYDNVSIYNGNLKLNWRVDWPAKWALFKTTCEPAGKDHCVKGGSYDTGLELCHKVFNYEGPVKIAYEWIRLGDRDMKTSKGLVFTPKKFLEIADPELYRMLILRTNPLKHISLRIEEMPQYNDYYERMENIYYDVEIPESDEERNFFKYLYPLTKINDTSIEKPKNIPLKLLIFLSQIQNILSIEKLYDKAKLMTGIRNLEKEISINEFAILLERTKNWLDEIKKIIENEKDNSVKRNILQKISLFEIPDEYDKSLLNKLDKQQINGIKRLRNFLLEKKKLEPDLIQNKLFTLAKEDLNITPKKMFEAVYQIILGKKYGPRLGSFLVLLDRNWLLERLNVDSI